MRKLTMFFAIGATAVAVLVSGLSTPAIASPVGTTFTFLADNFQKNTDPTPWDPLDPFAGGLDAFDPAVPFGVPTYIPAAGVTVGSSVTTSPTIPGFTLGGLDFVEFWIDTYTDGDGGYLNADGGADSAFVIDGLNWGPGAPDAVATGAFFIQFDDDGVYKPLISALGIPIVPHPINGFDSIVLDVTGDPASTIPLLFGAYGGDGLGFTLAAALSAFGVPPLEISGVNSIHIGFEVIHVPEPASMMMLGTGLASVLLMRRRRNR